jgi:hypothetical protein
MGDVGVSGAWLMLAVVVVGAVLTALGCVWLANRIISRETGPEHNSVLSPFLTVVGLIYGTFLGFTVVVGWQQYRSAEVNASNEASALMTLYRQTVAVPQPEQSQLREQLRKYAVAVQGPEWDKQDSGEISSTARAALTEMYRIQGKLQPNAASNPTNQEFLSELSTLAADRSRRILDARLRMPPLLWCSLIFGGILLIVLTSFLRLASTLGHVILVSAVTVLLGLLLYLLFALDHPFGPLGVTPQPFAGAVRVFDSVDSGP